MRKVFSVGEIVESIKGRDKTNLFLIYRIECDKIYLVNGDNRLICKPKIKNANHIASTGVVVENLKQKILEGKNVFDAEIFSALKKYKQNLKGE